jgi:hypothetical protein
LRNNSDRIIILQKQKKMDFEEIIQKGKKITWSDSSETDEEDENIEEKLNFVNDFSVKSSNISLTSNISLKKYQPSSNRMTKHSGRINTESNISSKVKNEIKTIEKGEIVKKK